MTMTALASPANGQSELIACFGEPQADDIKIAVCIPTFRRPEMLRATLLSVLQQQGSPAVTRNGKAAPRFAIVVVDNDARDRAGAAVASAMLHEANHTASTPGYVLIEPRQGNCKAYNAAWSHVRRALPQVTMICGLDDDEQAAPDWLSALLMSAERSGAQIVGGRVTPVFADARFDHLKRHPIFRSHYEADGLVPQIYSSANYLMQSTVLDTLGYPYLDERFDFTGGGDTDFFSRARLLGFRFAWANNAVLTETIPARRTEPDWIRARALRNGMISALIAHKADPTPMGRARTMAKSLALLAASPFRGIVDGVRNGSGAVALYHAQVAVGRLGAEFGLTIEQYRSPEAN